MLNAGAGTRVDENCGGAAAVVECEHAAWPDGWIVVVTFGLKVIWPTVLAASNVTVAWLPGEPNRTAAVAPLGEPAGVQFVPVPQFVSASEPTQVDNGGIITSNCRACSAGTLSRPPLLGEVT